MKFILLFTLLAKWNLDVEDCGNTTRSDRLMLLLKKYF